MTIDQKTEELEEAGILNPFSADLDRHKHLPTGRRLRYLASENRGSIIKIQFVPSKNFNGDSEYLCGVIKDYSHETNSNDIKLHLKIDKAESSRKFPENEIISYKNNGELLLINIEAFLKYFKPPSIFFNESSGPIKPLPPSGIFNLELSSKEDDSPREYSQMSIAVGYNAIQRLQDPTIPFFSKY